MFPLEKIDEIMVNTSEAYSFNRYGPIAWRKSIENLRELGYTQSQIENVLFSKYMRWAGDEFSSYIGNDEQGYEVFDGFEIVKFHEKFHNNSRYSNRGKLCAK